MWQRRAVAAALADMLTAATAGTVYVHKRPPEMVNPMAVVIGRTGHELDATAAFGTDEIELPVLIVGGLESDDDIDDIKYVLRTTVMGDTTLKGTVQTAWPTEARGWRNMTGAGGIQLLYVEQIITIHM